MKITIEQVEATLLENKIDKNKVQEIVKDLTQVVEEEQSEKEATSGPKAKWEHIIVLNDSDGTLKGKELIGYVVVQQDGEDAGLVLSKLLDAAKEQNETAKRKKNRLDTLTSVFGFLKSKFLKEKKLKIKTKEAVRVLITNESLKS